MSDPTASDDSYPLRIESAEESAFHPAAGYRQLARVAIFNDSSRSVSVRSFGIETVYLHHDEWTEPTRAYSDPPYAFPYRLEPGDGIDGYIDLEALADEIAESGQDQYAVSFRAYVDAVGHGLAHAPLGQSTPTPTGDDNHAVASPNTPGAAPAADAAFPAPETVVPTPAAGRKPNVPGTRDPWWRRALSSAWRVANQNLVATTIGVTMAVAGTIYVVNPAADDPPPATTRSDPASHAGSPASGAGLNDDPRARIVELTGSWSTQGFADAIVDRDTSIVALYLKTSMKATTVHKGASAILWGFQGVPQNGDPVALVKAFQVAGFKIDDELEDRYLMQKLTNNYFPSQFDTDLTPKGYTGGYQGGRFVGSLLFWIVQRAMWSGPTSQDIRAIKYLSSQDADCKVPLSFLKFYGDALTDSSPYEKLLPMMQSCAK